MTAVTTPDEIAEDLLNRFHKEAVENSWEWLYRSDAVVARMGVTAGAEQAVLKARAEKALLLLVREGLTADLGLNGRFKPKTGWAWLDKLLLQARLKELRAVRIVRKGGAAGLRFGIDGLKATFYGRQILNNLGFGNRRRVVDRDELETIKAALARIKLKLPELVERTTTEKFFYPDESEG
jgi:hypothetical protein